MQKTWREIPLEKVTLLPGLFRDRATLNREYMMSLKNRNLLQNHYLEAGLWDSSKKPEDCHWGWESPTCQLRGHFLGHWLSAAAFQYRANDDYEIKVKADRIVAELARCQKENGGKWVGSIPEKYLEWISRGKRVWAPQYTLHKTLMGLVDMYRYADNAQALDVLCKFADWFYEWSEKFTREEFHDILDFETGGMLEVWADLYGITEDERHLALLRRYDRPRLFEPLIKGEDVLTNMHANTTIPEVLGAARAWEVTGEERWFRVVEAYWEQAVTKRGYFCTGGQTSGEMWTPPFSFSDRLGDKTQEHCTVYNMIRLADFLLRWTGDATYADYVERNIYNGLLAQQNPQTGMVAYFLPLEPGARKIWGTPTENFWCCHGTLLQAQTMYNRLVFYEDESSLLVSQYIPARLEWQKDGVGVVLEQVISPQTGDNVAINETNLNRQSRPEDVCVELNIKCAEPKEFSLRLRVPWWARGQVTVNLNGQTTSAQRESDSVVSITRIWHENSLVIRFPKQLTAVALPDSPERVAFLDGPVVLAGLVDRETKLYGDKDNPRSMIEPHNVRQWQTWLSGYRTYGQPQNIRFKPLYEITDETYTVYFPVDSAQ